ncbi:MAG: DivIVA domain-containing protein, partial [Angelakisella sp.]
EDSLRSALIGAQKLGDSILKESRQKAEKIIQDATARAEKIASEAITKVDKQQYELEQMQAEAADFKERLFALYRTHLDVIKNIPSDYDHDRKPRAKKPPSPQPAAAQPEPENDAAEADEYHPTDLAGNEGFDEQGTAIYTEDYTETADYGEDTEERYPQPTLRYKTRQEAEADEQLELEMEPQEVYFEEPYAAEKHYDMEEPEDEPSIIQKPYKETFYDEPSEAARDIRSDSQGLPEDDTTIYHAPPRREENPFATPPMVQLEFDVEEYDDYEEDEFAEEKKLLREANLNRIPYLDDDDDDDDDFAVQLTSRKKPVVSQKFGILKFGDAFNLKDD